MSVLNADVVACTAECKNAGDRCAALTAGRLVKPEWGVPNAVLHSGSGTSLKRNQ